VGIKEYVSLKVRGLRLPWRKSKVSAEDFDFEDLAKIIVSDALYNRAVMSPETLSIYHRMIAAPREAANRKEGARLCGQLFYELIATFAREAGKAAPDNPKAVVEFVKNELKGFETPEATERRERATLNELFKLLGTNRRV
jgi:hypothetical protein